LNASEHIRSLVCRNNVAISHHTLALERISNAVIESDCVVDGGTFVCFLETGRNDGRIHILGFTWRHFVVFVGLGVAADGRFGEIYGYAFGIAGTQFFTGFEGFG
jgi:hypothetical protein